MSIYEYTLVALNIQNCAHLFTAVNKRAVYGLSRQRLERAPNSAFKSGRYITSGRQVGVPRLARTKD